MSKRTPPRRALPHLWILCLALLPWSHAPGHAADLRFRHLTIDANGPRDPWVKIVGDVNGDGHADVIIGGRNGPVVWYAWPKWNKAVIGPGVAGVVDGEVGDMDRDGALDVVTAEMHQSARDRVLLYLNEDKGARWSRQVVATTGSHNVRLADFGNDGRLAIVGANWSEPYQPIEMWEQLSPESAAKSVK